MGSFLRTQRKMTDLVKESEYSRLIYIRMNACGEGKKKSKDKAKSSYSPKSITSLNREDINKRKHFRGEKGLTTYKV